MIPLNAHLTLCINVDELASHFLFPLLSLSSPPPAKQGGGGLLQEVHSSNGFPSSFGMFLMSSFSTEVIQCLSYIV